MKYLKWIYYLQLIGVCFFYKESDFVLALDSTPFDLESIDFVVEELPQDIWFSRLEGGYAAGRWMGFKKNYGEIGVFVAPLLFGEEQSFIDLRTYLIQDRHWGGSIGTGIRQWNPRMTRALGGNFYYDYRPSSVRAVQRIGIGLESLGQTWDFRFNGYLLVHGSVKRGHLHVYHHLAGFVESCRIKEYAFSSVDAEVECHVWRRQASALSCVVGPYYLNGHHHHIFGGFVSLQFNWLDHFMLEGNLSYDHTFHTQVQGKAILTLPLYGLLFEILPQTQKQRILTQPVRRNPMITTRSHFHRTQNW